MRLRFRCFANSGTQEVAFCPDIVHALSPQRVRGDLRQVLIMVAVGGEGPALNHRGAWFSMPRSREFLNHSASGNPGYKTSEWRSRIKPNNKFGSGFSDSGEVSKPFDGSRTPEPASCPATV